MNREGTRTLDTGLRVVDADRLPPVRTSIGPRPWQTTEGPKLYKRDGWYWIFVPSGSVKGGWQGVFRARTITGRWEGRDVLDQGGTDINGPHQGAWVRTAKGEDWFLHFHDADSYGRRVFLEPMRWRDGWPVIGEDPDDDGIGQPVLTHVKPRLAAMPPHAPEGDDTFDTGFPSLAWQWNANPAADWILPGPGGQLRLKSASTSGNLWKAGNLLSRKLPALAFRATTRLRFAPLRDGERAGLALFGSDYAWIGAERRGGRSQIVRVTRTRADMPESRDTVTAGPELPPSADLWLQILIEPLTVRDPAPDFTPYWPSMLRSTHARARYAYSLDGTTFVPLGAAFVSRPGRWVGAQIGLFAQAPAGTPAHTANTVGHADVDWFKLDRQPAG